MRVETRRRMLAVRHVKREIACQQGWMNHRLTALSLSESAVGALWTRVTAVVMVAPNGDVSVGKTFANQNFELTSMGNTTIRSTGLANHNYTVVAKGDINASGAALAGQNVTMTAGDNRNAAPVTANGAASLTVGSLSARDTQRCVGYGLQTRIDSRVHAQFRVLGSIAPERCRKACRRLATRRGDRCNRTVALAVCRTQVAVVSTLRVVPDGDPRPAVDTPSTRQRIKFVPTTR